MKKDSVPNLLRWKCSCFELNIYHRIFGAGILLRASRNHGAGAEKDISGSQCIWKRVLHGRWLSLLSAVWRIKKDCWQDIRPHQSR
jgi:hypothetical protein